LKPRRLALKPLITEGPAQRVTQKAPKTLGFGKWTTVRRVTQAPGAKVFGEKFFVKASLLGKRGTKTRTTGKAKPDRVAFGKKRGVHRGTGSSKKFPV